MHCYFCSSSWKLCRRAFSLAVFVLVQPKPAPSPSHCLCGDRVSFIKGGEEMPAMLQPVPICIGTPCREERRSPSFLAPWPRRTTSRIMSLPESIKGLHNDSRADSALRGSPRRRQRLRAATPRCPGYRQHLSSACGPLVCDSRGESAALRCRRNRAGGVCSERRGVGSRRGGEANPLLPRSGAGRRRGGD